MKIKSKITRKAMVLLVVAITALSFVASAAIVNYLSTEVHQNDITVHSPFKLAMSNHMQTEWDNNDYPAWDHEDWDNKISDDYNFMAGHTGRFWVGFENMANNDIPATMKVTVTCDEGIDGGEVDSLKFWVKNPEWDTSHPTWGPHEIVGAGYGTTTWNTITYEVPMDIIGNGYVPAETTYIVQADLTLSQYAPGTYDVSIQIV